ncbi:AAA family ATPase [Parabacteroides sp. Marseille-P3160]|uniref:AAA family ATPase n=1 Tax=Parabacteroides sp. Marseille-P3160 TaxID=1917887 RepID=UPI0009BB16AC|nr:AAA family ATPase [Parabacteroides sp. Marseille-P3160]
MKIIAIRGKNLASLEGEFEIDFTREPLLSAGIFAITGSTGAGKSTLLDALCLALFDNTPRTNSASENLLIADVKDKSISQGDSRNLLRRGTSDGYAEVDFIALNGMRYRARWMVRRARDKATGSLQAAEIRLTNLTTATEEQGRKTELLQKISELIGLSFSQFTRSVLLAQGDFATFLKARQNEKAELLEKLTGTEVYSRISIAIYEKTREAEQQLQGLKERMQDIRLLEPEELAACQAEKENLEKERQATREQARIGQGKIDWYKQEALLKKALEEVEALLAGSRQALQEAAPRKAYLQQIEKAQEIRDVYTQWGHKEKRLKELGERIPQNEQRESAHLLSLSCIAADLNGAQSALEQGERRYTALKPEIERAKVLDTQLQAAERNVREAAREFEFQKKIKEETEQRIKTLEKELAVSLKKKEQGICWFSDHAAYRDIVPRQEMLAHMLKERSDAAVLISGATNNLASNRSVCEGYRKEEELLKAKLEQLNRLLPAEVLPLRKRLVEGTPCPVCGSVHHPIFTMETPPIGLLKEKEIETAKKQATDRLELLRTQREESERQTERFQTQIQTYGKAAAETEKRLAEYLAPLTDWKEKADKGLLVRELTSVAALWVQNQEALDHCIASIGQAQARLEGETRNLETASENYHKREELLRQAQTAWQALKSEREQLLQGRKVEDAETYFERLREANTLKLEELKKQKEILEKQLAETRGILSQLKSEQQKETNEKAQLWNEIADWIVIQNNKITFAQLQELLSRERAWINREQEQLKQLEDRMISLTATVRERQEKRSEWEQAPTRPQTEETQEVLQQFLTEVAEKEESIHNRITTIQVALATHESGKKQLAAFERELEEKTAAYEDWNKLNELFGSANGSKFKRIAQSYTLDALLVYANKQLEQLSKRYLIRRIPDTLGLEVVDQDLFNDVRTVHSLSGGESFLVSLSLALGLSSLSSNRMKIESLFIDEGFGSLDMETLNTVMEALEALHTQGRKIGVISHVAEMTERIPVQIAVLKTANGRSRVEIKKA